MPDNGRKAPPVMVNMLGDQVGIVRFYTHIEVNNERMPNLTHVLSFAEEIEYRRGSRQGKYYFHGEVRTP